MDEMKIKRISELEEIDEAPEGATLLAYADGELKRLKAGNVGGGKRAVFKVDMGSSVSVANLMSGAAPAAAAPTQEYPAMCDTITFEEARSALLAGEAVGVGMTGAIEEYMSIEGGVLVYAPASEKESEAGDGNENSGQQDAIIGFVSFMNVVMMVNWTADGITVQIN